MARASLGLFSIILVFLGNTANAATLSPQATYAELPCLTDAENAEWLKAKLDLGKLPGALCGDGSVREKVGKILAALPALQVRSATAASNYRVAAALGDPRGFLRSRLASISVAEVQVVEAHKWRGRGAVELAPHFFLLSPFEGAVDLLSLFVDAEKTSEYKRCHTGKYTMTNSCAQEFRSGETAGASAAKILLLLRLAQFAPDAATAESIRALASKVGMERILKLPASEGATIDLFYALDSEGRLYRVEPFLKSLSPIALPEAAGKIVRIKHDRKSGGLLLFTAQGGLWKFHPVSEFAEELKLPFPIKDYEPSTTYLLDGIQPRHFPIDLLVDTQNRAWLISQIGENAGAKPWPAKEHQLPFNLKSLANCWIAADCLLDDQGYHWSFYYLFSSVQRYDQHQNSDNLPWRQLSGGFFYDEIWGVNEAGKLFYRDMNAHYDYPLDESFQSKSPSTFKYVEASTFRALIDAENQLFLTREYTRRGDSVWPGTKGMRTWKLDAGGAKIIDVDRTLSARFNIDLKNIAPISRQHFTETCAITQAVTSPWSGKSVGLTANGALVFEGTGEKLCLTSLEQFAPGSTVAVEVDPTERFRHPEAALVITSPTGERKVVVPYN